MHAKNITGVLLLAVLAGCATRAPTDYELDRRAGLVPTVEVERLRREAEDIHQVNADGKSARQPPRSQPRLERIWVYDQELDGGYWLQGTYVFLEVEPGRWLEDSRTGGSKS
jgi:hypothetical protein